MICPECNIDLACPCESCKGWENNKPKWISKDHNGIHIMKCPVCGFWHTEEYWMDFMCHGKIQADIMWDCQKDIPEYKQIANEHLAKYPEVVDKEQLRLDAKEWVK